MWREFRQEGRRHWLVWRIAVEGDVVHTEHGVLDGQMVPTSDRRKPVNVGKSNEKSAEVMAQEEADRQILKKTRSGYIEFVLGAPVSKTAGMTWDTLPQSLRLWKPTNTLGAGLAKRLREREAWAARKREGIAAPVFFDENGEVQIYSRIMLPTHKDDGRRWADRYPHIVEGYRDLQARFDIPPKTLFPGELVVDRDGVDDFYHVQGVDKSLTERALQLQEEGGRLQHYVWDIAFWGGEALCEAWSFQERYTLIDSIFPREGPVIGVDYLRSRQILDVCEAHDIDDPVDALRAEATLLGWEGWVIVDPELSLEDRSWNLRGKVERSAPVAGKLKPYYDCDCIAIWNPDAGEGTWGRGKNQQTVGSVALYQFNADGDLVYLCNCGGGIKDRGKDKKAPEDAPFRDIFEPGTPVVVEVRYEGQRRYKSQGDKTNAVDFPRLLRIREDKLPEECEDELL